MHRVDIYIKPEKIMKLKYLVFILCAVLVLLPSVVSADNITMSNTTTRDITDIAYPNSIFIILTVVSFLMLIFIIAFLIMNPIPCSALALTSTLGFVLFLICAYMAPLTAEMVWVVSGTEAKFISTYIYSPWVSYLFYGLSSICFVMIWYSVLLYFRMIQQNKAKIERDQMYAITGIDVD